jgi:hypothetical protein
MFGAACKPASAGTAATAVRQSPKPDKIRIRSLPWLARFRAGDRIHCGRGATFHQICALVKRKSPQRRGSCQGSIALRGHDQKRKYRRQQDLKDMFGLPADTLSWEANATGSLTAACLDGPSQKPKTGEACLDNRTDLKSISDRCDRDTVSLRGMLQSCTTGWRFFADVRENVFTTLLSR